MSHVYSTRLAATDEKLTVAGSVMASDVRWPILGNDSRHPFRPRPDGESPRTGPWQVHGLD